MMVKKSEVNYVGKDDNGQGVFSWVMRMTRSDAECGRILTCQHIASLSCPLASPW